MTDEPENLPALPQNPMEMIAHAVANGADPVTLERLLAMQERWEASQARKAFYKALASARGNIGPIFKNIEAKIGPGRTQRSEDLAQIEREVVPELSKHGLIYSFGIRVPDNKPDTIIVTCRIEHKDGHYEERQSLPGQPDTSGQKSPLQALGSAVTYLKRITLKAALGLSTTEDMVDDDGAGGGEEKITEHELVQLRERIEQVGQTEGRVCDYYGVVELQDLPRAKFAAAMKKLEASAKK
jgi:ERF superfamily